MADQQQQQQQQQQQPEEEEDELFTIPPFPPPPPFFQHFTTENLDKLKEIQDEVRPEALTDDGTPAKLSIDQILRLPTELRYLIPPEPPAESDEFKVFGTVTSAKGSDSFIKTMEWISQTLANDYTITDWTYEQLYPPTDSSSSASASTDRQRYLFRFLRSILIAYIELLGIVAVNPVSDHKEQKLRDILTMVTNMHALINEYRPHQARETLILEMEKQVKRKKMEIEGVKKMKDRVAEVLEGFGREVPGEKVEKSEENTVRNEEERRKDAQRHMWRAMDEILGQ
ncbi:mediator of RNA polymerase II transcription subunit 7 [Ophiobolus disseminans]|uniref:Mediator of RNA polymerase II transcription subunit 7 n=1 Tax=Ophiobolus disseminans TaxID=1469910 RepID=A0A6A6ZXW8_9PLEO|nr:mediator of RNA polymerase II transcription subunit 7 [Ophiobolus disseminans]